MGRRRTPCPSESLRVSVPFSRHQSNLFLNITILRLSR